MRTTVTLDDELRAKAIEATGVTERTALIHDGLRALISRANARALIAMGGSDPEAWAPDRHRPARR